MEQYIPNVRVSRFGLEDRDNFVRNLATILLGPPVDVDTTPRVVTPVTKAKAAGALVVPLDAVKLHLRIELNQTIEDTLLTDLILAAHIHTENYLRKPIDETVGQHIKQALLFLVAHWYRNREAVITGTIASITPMAYDAILGPERDYPVY
jgi:hypothetical protein